MCSLAFPDGYHVPLRESCFIFRLSPLLTEPLPGRQLCPRHRMVLRPVPGILTTLFLAVALPGARGLYSSGIHVGGECPKETAFLIEALVNSRITFTVGSSRAVGKLSPMAVYSGEKANVRGGFRPYSIAEARRQLWGSGFIFWLLVLSWLVPLYLEETCQPILSPGVIQILLYQGAAGFPVICFCSSSFPGHSLISTLLLVLGMGVRLGALRLPLLLPFLT